MGVSCSVCGNRADEQEIVGEPSASKQQLDYPKITINTEEFNLSHQNFIDGTSGVQKNYSSQILQKCSLYSTNTLQTSVISRILSPLKNSKFNQKLQVKDQKGELVGLQTTQRKKNKIISDSSEKQRKDNVSVLPNKIHPADLREIQSILRKHFIFSRFSQKEIHNTTQEMKYCVGNEDTYIYKEGDQSLYFYIVLLGEVVQQRDEYKKILYKGNYFGDLGILYNYRRSSSIFVKSACLLVCLAKESLQRLLSKLKNFYKEENFQILSSNKFFNKFEKPQIKQLAAKCVSINYKEKDVIFRKGDYARSLYIIRQGYCENIESSVTYKPNQLIDKQILQNDQHTERTFTLIAKTECSLLILNKAEAHLFMKKQIQQKFYKEQIIHIIKWNHLESKFPECNWEKSLKNMVIIRFKAKDLVFSKNSNLNKKIIFIVMRSALKSQSGKQIKANAILYQRKLEELGIELSKMNYYAEGQGFYAIIKLNNENRLQTYPFTHQLKSLCLKDFLFVKKLHHGSNSRIYCCFQPILSKKYAVKVLDKHKLTSKNIDKYSVSGEEQIFSQFSSDVSPFIVKYQGYFQNGAYAHTILQMIEGQNLSDFVNSNPLTLQQIIFVSAQALLALQFLHSYNIIYRNLRKQNFMICLDNFIKLIDFGISKRLSGLKRFRTSTIVGSPEYMSPEMVNGKSYGFEFDIWTLGVFIYELTCNYLPFGNNQKDPIKIFEQILNSEPVFPPYIESDCKKLLKKLLNKSKSIRMEGGFPEIKSSHYFQKIDWKNLKKKMVTSNICPKKHVEINSQEINESITRNKKLSEVLKMYDNTLSMTIQ